MRAAPWKALAALTALVALAHAAVLGGALLQFDATAPASVRAVSLRSIAADPIAAESSTPALSAASPQPAPPRRQPPARSAAPARDEGNAAAPGALPQHTAHVTAPVDAPVLGQGLPAAQEEQLALSRAAGPGAGEPGASTGPTPARRSAARTPRRYLVPASTHLVYDISANKFPYSARAELLWQHDANNYSAKLELRKLVLVRSQSSVGQVGADGLAPTRFADRTRSELAAHFERERGRISFSANTPEALLLAGAQDRLSVLVQLAAMLAGVPEDYPAASTISMQVVGPREADTWHFTVGEAQTLELGGTSMNTVKVTRNPRQQYDQTVELWLAPALGYLPARVRITDPNGDFVDQHWRATLPP